MGRRECKRVVHLSLEGGRGRVTNLHAAFQCPSPGSRVGQGCLHTHPLEDQEKREEAGGCLVKGTKGWGGRSKGGSP